MAQSFPPCPHPGPLPKYRETESRRLLVIACLILFPLPAHAADRLQFNRDIRPILSDKCFRCHGPDSASRQAELRLDSQQEATRDLGGYQAIVPGKRDASAAWRRISSNDPEERMPPADSGLTLTLNEIELLGRWIDQGAQYQPHWSLIPPARPALPAVQRRGWPRNPIDCFVLAKLEQEGLQPSPEADRRTLLRRVTLDLTGLPPTIAEIGSFLADNAPDAYLRAVDRLLTSPRYGERMALPWLDAARYADTNGFFVDTDRHMWRWRDWVIDAFNRNQSFDQFSVEQLAGDLLPSATVEQKIATGFNRNHMTTHETGVIDEEYRVEYVVDRVDTTATVWLGLSMGCARCHDHKYDPISQREFYQFFAFFNNVPEKGNVGAEPNSKPLLSTPTREQELRMAELRRLSDQAAAAFKRIEPQIASAQAAWERTALNDVQPPSRKALMAHWDVEEQTADASGNKRHGTLSGKAEFVEGMVGSALALDGYSHVEVRADLPLDRDSAVSYGGWVFLSEGRPSCVLSRMDDEQGLRGFDLIVEKGKAAADFNHRAESNSIRVQTKQSLPRNRWHHLLVTYDGSSRAAGVKIYIDGFPAPVDVMHDNLTGTIQTPQPLRLGRRQSSAGLQGMLDDIRIYGRVLSAVEVKALATGQLLAKLLSMASDQRTADERERLQTHYLAEHAAPELRTVYDAWQARRREQQDFAAQVPTTMIMQELDERRETFVLARGQYDHPGEKVTPGVPASLPALPADLPQNRLGLARWLVAPAHPLTARVTVNRFWQQYFGVGIVKTVNDFGSQGEWPVHPELLDWLASEFVRSGWDVKAMQRLIVTSATYRQSSRQTTELVQLDPENRLLARGPRFRMDAELVRDQALATSGLLLERLGGPSVKPYQPAGLWEAVSYNGDQTYEQDHGEALYRRSMYTFWKRQSPPPAMLAFDGPTRETCTVRRSRTNTPLQALVLLNDPTYLEAARILAERMLTEAASDPESRIEFGFQLATARLPDAEEVAALLQVYRGQLEEFGRNPAAAEQLLGVGEAPRDPELEVVELAAWAVVAGTILNLDETVTKN